VADTLFRQKERNAWDGCGTKEDQRAIRRIADVNRVLRSTRLSESTALPQPVQFAYRLLHQYHWTLQRHGIERYSLLVIFGPHSTPTLWQWCEIATAPLRRRTHEHAADGRCLKAQCSMYFEGLAVPAFKAISPWCRVASAAFACA